METSLCALLIAVKGVDDAQRSGLTRIHCFYTVPYANVALFVKNRQLREFLVHRTLCAPLLGCRRDVSW